MTELSTPAASSVSSFFPYGIVCLLSACLSLFTFFSYFFLSKLVCYIGIYLELLASEMYIYSLFNINSVGIASV